MKHASADDLRKILQKRVSEAPSAAAVAAELGISRPYLTELLRGTRQINARIATLLGYEKVVAFRKKNTRAQVA